MKDLAKRAGFEFVEASEINANPKDTADHPFGVWTLPPRSRLPKEGSVEAADFNAVAYEHTILVNGVPNGKCRNRRKDD
jgi:predicted methyltransferase